MTFKILIWRHGKKLAKRWEQKTRRNITIVQLGHPSRYLYAYTETKRNPWENCSVRYEYRRIPTESKFILVLVSVFICPKKKTQGTKIWTRSDDVQKSQQLRAGLHRRRPFLCPRCRLSPAQGPQIYKYTNMQIYKNTCARSMNMNNGRLYSL